MVRFLCTLALVTLPATALAAGSIDTVNVGTEVKDGKTYLKVDGGYTSSSSVFIIRVDIKCTTKPALDESDLAAELLPSSKYKRLSNKEVEVQTYEVTVTLFENGVAAPAKKKKVNVTKDGANWIVTEVLLD